MRIERQIGPLEDGKELKVILKHGLKLSATMISRLKATQGIYVNGNPVFTNYICHAGDHVILDLSSAEPIQSIVPEQGELSILYEDAHLLAVYKPEGMLSHPSRAQFSGTLMGFVLGYLSQSGFPSCHAMNRLDRYTSGIVLFAKNAYAKALFSRSLQHAKKDYLAVTFGKVQQNCGTIDLPIKRMEDGNIMRCISSDGAKAITHYTVLKTVRYDDSDLSVLSLKPETGRTHQLRLHCLSLGHPIVGDQLYCTAESKAFSEHMGVFGQLLHAERLQFTHPVTEESIDIRCPVSRKEFAL